MYYTLSAGHNSIFAIRPRNKPIHHVIAFRRARDAFVVGRCIQNHLDLYGRLPETNGLSPSGLLRVGHQEAPMTKVRMKTWDDEDDLLFFCSVNNLGVAVCHTPKKSRFGFILIQETKIQMPNIWQTIVLNHLYEKS